MIVTKEAEVEINPDLTSGSTYLVTALKLGSVHDREVYLGRVFTYVNVAGTHALVWLEDEERGGGWDSTTLINQYDIRYSAVNLTLTK